MEKIELYRTYIKNLLTDYAKDNPSDEEVETELIFDTERDHYQVFYVGWRNSYPVYGPVLHLDIKRGKIWIQHNGTEMNIASQLVDLGVPKSDIVLGFQEPFVRQYTDFAVD